MARLRAYFFRKLGAIILLMHLVESCDEGWLENKENCYKVFTTMANKTVAESTCFDLYSGLASVSNVEDHSFLSEELNRTASIMENFWVGLHKINNKLTWNNRDTADDLSWVDVSTLPGSGDCFIFNSNSTQVFPHDCSYEAGFVCEQWNNLITRRYTQCPLGTDKYLLSEKCFWYTHMPLSKAGSEVLCSLKHGHLIIPKEDVISLDLAMVLLLHSPPSTFLWTSLVVKNGTFLFADGTQYNNDIRREYDTGDCVAFVLERGVFLFRQMPCYKEAFGFCEISLGFFSVSSASIFGNPRSDVKANDFGKSCPAGENWKEDDNTGYCYWETSYETSRLSWEDAQKYCQSYGGNLASFHTSIEERIGLGFQFGAIEHSYWMGLYYHAENDEYLWADGSSLDYTNWDTDQPNHVNRRMRCGFMSSVKKKWSLNYCGMLSWFICKAPKQINPPAPVPPTQEPIVKCNEDSSEFFFNDYCYQSYTDLLSWHRANNFCINRGSNLASLHDENEINFVIRLFAANQFAAGNRAWIGLNSLGIDGAFRWADGTPFNFANWDVNEPNKVLHQEKCANMYTQHGMWNDENCNAVMGFVCKRNNRTIGESNATTTIPPPTGYCKKDWYIFGGRCFLPVGVKESQWRTWVEAGMYCLNQGGILASVRSARDQAFMNFLLQKLKMSTWIGLHDSVQSSVFYWVDNSPLNYTNWARGEPSPSIFKEDCVLMKFDTMTSGLWMDADCRQKQPFICQTTPDPTIEVPYVIREMHCIHYPGYTKQGLACYKMFSDPLAWSEAEDICQNENGHLVSIYDLEVDAVVNYLAAASLGDNETFWIGLLSTDKYEFKWLNGWPLSFSRWGSNEPQNKEGRCFFSSMNGLWLGGESTEKKKFMCQINAEPPPQLLPPIGGHCNSSSVMGWTEIGKSCFFIHVRWLVDRFTADFECYRKGATLASIHSMETLTELSKAIEGGYRPSILIGLTRNAAGGFTWTDGSPVDFVNWDQGQPAEIGSCVEMMLDTMKWKVSSCFIRRFYLCSKDKVNQTYPTGAPFQDVDRPVNNGQTSGLPAGGIVAIVACLAIVVAAAVVLWRLYPWKQEHHYRVSSIDQITSFENAVYSDEPHNIDFHDKKVLYEKNCS